MNIAERLKTERTLRGMSLSALAEKAEVSKAYLWQLEAGNQSNPSLDVLKRLADALDITVGRLIGGDVARAAQVEVPPPEDPGLTAFLEERRRRGRPVPQADVQLLLQLQWRGGSRGDRPKSKDDWALFYERILPMWERGTGEDDDER